MLDPEQAGGYESSVSQYARVVGGGADGCPAIRGIKEEDYKDYYTSHGLYAGLPDSWVQ